MARSRGVEPVEPVIKEDAAASATSPCYGTPAKITVPFSKVLASRAAGKTGPLGTGTLGWSCDWEVRLEPCTLCFPGTDWCWEDTCLVIRLNCHSDLV